MEYLFAIIFKTNPIAHKRYEWEKENYNPDEDLFLQHFDEDGNFIDATPENNLDGKKGEEKNENIKPTSLTINYTLKKNPKSSGK